VNGNFIQNAATARLYGLDLDATARLTDEFTLTAGLNLLHAHYVTFPNAAVEFPLPLRNGKPNGNSTIVLPSLAGYQMPRAPNATFSTTADYKKVFSAGTFDLNGTVYYSSRIYFDSNQRISQSPYATLAMQASFQPAGSRFRLQVWGKNLTNATYISSVYEDGPADGVNYAPAPSYGVALKYSF
jgi:iron complex outermembrane receptor protein